MSKKKERREIIDKATRRLARQKVPPYLMSDNAVNTLLLEEISEQLDTVIEALTKKKKSTATKPVASTKAVKKSKPKKGFLQRMFTK